MENSSNLGLPYILPQQAQKHVTHNEAIRMLDALVQISVMELARNDPPSGAAEGDRYIIGANPTAEFANQEGKLAAFQDGAWAFLTPRIGWLIHVVSENAAFLFDGTHWGPVAKPSNSADQFGINSNADPVNRLSVKSDSINFSHDDVTPGTGDVRLVLNKAQSGGTSSLIFQSNWSGRAEMGLAGSDAFEVKVSVDGIVWTSAFTIAPESGKISHSAGGRHSFVHDSSQAGISVLPAADDPASPTDGDLWYNSTIGRFRKKENGAVSDLAKGSSGGANPAGAHNTLQFNDAGAFGGASNLYYDAINQRVGLGVVNPIHQFDISENFNFPASTASVGTLYQAGARFLHSFGTNNVFIGNKAGNYTLTGTANTALGRLSLSALTTGSANLALGDLAMRFMTTGQQNVAVGSTALTNATTARFNIAIGTNTLSSLVTTNGNIAIGYNAMLNCVSGNNCTAVGYQAGMNLTTGVNNTLIGANSGSGITTGSHNTIIGPATGLAPALANTVILADGQGNQRVQANSLGLTADGYVKPKSYTVAGVPAAAVAGAGAMIFVSNEAGGAVPAFSDGTSWRRMTDRAIVS